MEDKTNIKRYAYIDLIKTIAIIMVIILHSGLLKTDFIMLKSAKSAVQFAIRIILEGVPLFVMVNGFLLLHKDKFELKKHLKKVLKIFILLILWSIIYIVIKTILMKEQLSIGLVWKNVLTTDINNKYTGILWFLQNLIMLYLIYPILKYLYDNNKKLYNYLFVIIIISTVGINFVNMLIDIIIKISNFEQLRLLTSYIKKFNILSNNQFLMFFMFGGYLYEKKDRFTENNKKIKYTIIGLISWMLSFIYAYIMSKINNKTYSNSFNYDSIFMIFIMLGIFAITNFYIDKGRFYNKMITSISKNSLGIYLIHNIIINIINVHFKILNTTFILRVTKIAFVLIISWLITLLLNKIPKIKELVKL